MRPSHPPSRAARRALLLALLVGSAAAAGCSHSYAVEDRDTPVHVWITAPELAANGGTLHALVYVGGQKVVEGPVTFTAGHPTVALPTVRLRAGAVPVSAVLDHGTLSASQRVSVAGESWVQVLVRGKAAVIRTSKEQPNPQGR